MPRTKFSSKNNRIINRKTPTYLNWGRGRLRYYQSFTSFAALFCSLNCIKPAEFRDYWLKIIGVNILGWNKTGYTEEQVHIIASLIDEPIAIVRTVVCKTAKNEKFRLMEEKLKIRNSLRYCESCVRLGYHGWVHEDMFIARCPIHGEYFQLIYSKKKGGANWDCTVSALGDLFREYCADWPGFVSGDFIRTSRRLFSCQRGYFEWKDAVASEIAKWTPLYTDYAYSIGDFGVNEIDVILGRLQWIRKLDNKFVDLLSARPLLLSPKLYRLSESLSEELTSVLHKIRLEALLLSLNISYLLEERRFVGVRNDNSSDYDDIITHRSDTCECVWRRGRYSQWTKVAPEDVRHYRGYICPYETARCDLELLWGNPLMSSMVRASAIFDYSEGIRVYVENGVFDVEWVRRPGVSKVPLVRPKFTLELSNLLSSIQVAIFESYLSELRDWLNKADAGRDIDFPIGVLPRAFLIENDGLASAVLVW